jgi:hypothetical protein
MTKKKRMTLERALQALLEEITELLQCEGIKPEEREILETARKGLQGKAYYLKVIGDLRGALTPLAANRKTSKAVSEFYSKLVSPDFMSKGLGGFVMMSASGIGF